MNPVGGDATLISSPSWASKTSVPSEQSSESNTVNDNNHHIHTNGNRRSASPTLSNRFIETFRKSMEFEQEDGIGGNGPLIEEDMTPEFFRPLIESDERLRGEALATIIEMLRASLESPSKDLVRTHLPTIVRLSREVPFDDITAAFTDLLKMIEKTNEFHIPKPCAPSSFISKTLFPPVNTDDAEIRQMFVDMFLVSGRVSHLNRVLGLHPSYFERYYNAYNFIMREPGPLPLDWRNYIAILSSSRQRCKWLVALQEQEFLANDGDPQWLKGIDYIPKKLQAILEVNQILSHQPWLMSKQHVAELVKGEDSWSIGELVHAMCIICTFKSLAGVVFGCGVTPEVDFPENSNTNIIEASEDEDSEVPGTILADTAKLTELLKGGWQNNEEAAEEQQHQEALFANAEGGVLESNHSHYNATTGGNDHLERYIGKQYSLYHADFDIKSKKIFRIQDYGWKEDGFELVRRFLSGAATLLDEEFDYIYFMTYNMFNENTNVDTFPFRRAIWQYVQRVKGIFHDDYNYQEVNIFLNKPTKSYIKRIVCVPSETTKLDYKNFGYELRHDEKVHVSLLAVESSKQSELLYGLHAVMKHMYNS